MISGIDLNATEDFILDNDKDNPTLWKIGVIPSLIFMQLAQEATAKEIEMAYKVLQLGLKGWTNFKDPKGAEIEYNTIKETVYGREVDVVPISLLERIPIEACMKISKQIMDSQKITDDERKN